MQRRVVMCVVLLVMGCRDKDTELIDTGEEEASPPVLLISGQAPWDPMFFESVEADESSERIAPEVDGVVLDESLSTSISGTYAWRASAGLDVGVHTVSLPEWADEAEQHEVLPYGVADDFSTEDVIGVTYEMDMDSPWVAVPGGGEILLSLLDGVWLTVTGIDGDEVIFEVHVQTTGEPICRALNARGVLSEGGELTWATDALDVETEQGDVPLRDMSIRGGWLADASAFGGAEGGGTMHTALLSQYLFASETGLTDEDEMCTQLMAFGVSCYDCLGDGDYCVDLRFHAGVMAPHSGTLPEDAPDCGVDLEAAEIGPIECTLPDISCAMAFVGLLGMTGWVRRRR